VGKGSGSRTSSSGAVRWWKRPLQRGCRAPGSQRARGGEQSPFPRRSETARRQAAQGGHGAGRRRLRAPARATFRALLTGFGGANAGWGPGQPCVLQRGSGCHQPWPWLGGWGSPSQGAGAGLQDHCHGLGTSPDPPAPGTARSSWGWGDLESVRCPNSSRATAAHSHEVSL